MYLKRSHEFYEEIPMLKRYIVFIFTWPGYPGWNEALRADDDDDPTKTPPLSFDTIEDAIEAAKEAAKKDEAVETIQVVDLHSGLIVFESTE